MKNVGSQQRAPGDGSSLCSTRIKGKALRISSFSIYRIKRERESERACIQTIKFIFNPPTGQTILVSTARAAEKELDGKANVYNRIIVFHSVKI